MVACGIRLSLLRFLSKLQTFGMKKRRRSRSVPEVNKRPRIDRKPQQCLGDEASALGANEHPDVGTSAPASSPEPNPDQCPSADGSALNSKKLLDARRAESASSPDPNPELCLDDQMVNSYRPAFMTQEPFSTLGLSETTTACVTQQLGLKFLTDVQSMTIPKALRGKDLLVQVKPRPFYTFPST